MAALVAIVSEQYIGKADQTLASEAIEVSAHDVDDELWAKLEAGEESPAKKIDIG